MAPDLHDIELSVNGTSYRRSVESRTLLSDFLRHELGEVGGRGWAGEEEREQGDALGHGGVSGGRGVSAGVAGRAAILTRPATR